MTLAELTNNLPPPIRVPGRRSALADDLVGSGRKLVVLDDDPTGTQTAHDVRVYFNWTPATFESALHDTHRVFFISTNSRGLSEAEAVALASELGANLRSASASTGVPFALASRSDSTLRGHFPAEVEAVRVALGLPPSVILLAPCLFEAGRYTVNDTHWVETAHGLVSAELTEFAADPRFGYRQGNLKKWVEEKTGGAIPASAVVSIALDRLRAEGANYVEQLLLGVSDGAIVVANAACYEDLEAIACGVSAAEARGRSLLYRTAASFVKVRGGIADRPLLDARELGLRPGPGLVVAGSYVGTTTAQLNVLLETGLVEGVELRISEVLDARRRSIEIDRIAREVGRVLGVARAVVLFTSRSFMASTADEVGRSTMAALCEIVGRLATKPSWIVAKGGITSIEIARRALSFRSAEVLGQLLPGISVWRAPPPWRDTPYVVFPGNVGGEGALVDAVRLLAEASG